MNSRPRREWSSAGARNRQAGTTDSPLLVRLQFIVLASNFLIKALILNIGFGVFALTAGFGTDLFSEEIYGFTFLYCLLVVNLTAYAFYRGMSSRRNRSSDLGRVDDSVNYVLIVVVSLVFVASFVGLGQKILSLSASLALLAIAANSRLLAVISLAIFVAGVPEAIALDEFIPLIFCAVLNIFVFLPWLATKGRKLLIVLGLVGLALLIALSFYYIGFRYNAFKLVERIFEQAAPLSWQGSAWLWFNPHAVLGGMPEEREVMVLEGTWDAQFKVTYLVANAPVLGSAFLLSLGYLLGRFAGRTLLNCRLPHSNVLSNFIRLKLLLILIEVMGEKVTDPGKIVAYLGIIAMLSVFDWLWTGGRHQARVQSP